MTELVDATQRLVGSGIAGDDSAAVNALADLVNRIGYDPVLLGSLRAGRALQPGTPVFGALLDRAVFEQAAPMRSLT